MNNHITTENATEIIKLATDRLEAIGAQEASDRLGEAMIPYKAVEARVKALRVDGVIHQVDHLLYRLIVREANKQRIRTVSGMYSVMFDKDDVITFKRGEDPRTMTRFEFDVLEYHGDISVSAIPKGSYIQNVFVKLVPTTVYLPADME